MSIARNLGLLLAPRIGEFAPEMTTTFVTEALALAIRGGGPLPPAAEAADRQLVEQDGDTTQAIRELIQNHVRYSGAQGFVTNLGGVVTAAVTIPATIAGQALVQCRLIAGIAHLRHHELADPRVRDAILTCLLGEDSVSKLVKTKKIPAPPMAIATAPVHDPDLAPVLCAEVASELVTKAAGKRLAVTVGRRTPMLGGLVGMGADGYATYQVGRYAERELLPRARR